MEAWGHNGSEEVRGNSEKVRCKVNYAGFSTKKIGTSGLTLVPMWSGRRDSNSRRSPWQGDALPLSHSRIV